MRFLFTALALLLASPALAQPAQPPQPPEVVALQSKLMQEINSTLQCTTAAITAQREIEKLTAELAALKPKDAPKK